MTLLHNHSVYSLLSGVVKVENLVAEASSQKIKSMALTDTNAIYGSVKFYKECIQNGIKPILGASISSANNSNYLLILAKNKDGFSELCKVITRHQLYEDYKIKEILSVPSKNLFYISSSTEVLPFVKDRNNFFIELLDDKKFRSENRRKIEVCEEQKFKFIPTHPIYFLKKDDFISHKVLRAIAFRTTLSNLTGDEFTNENYFFPNYKKFITHWSALAGAIENLNFVETHCNLDLDLNKIKFPSFPDKKNKSAFEILYELAIEGLYQRFKNPSKEAIERVNYEISVIDELGYCDYFLVVRDIVREAKQRGMMLIGRGSAANSLVSYCLGFTDVDPIKYNLYFERFLNRSRTSPPDIDLDFSWKERDEIVKYVFDKYGYDRVAMISTHVTFRARSAFREVAKVFGISDREISKFSKFIPWTNADNLPNLSELFPESKNLPFKEEPWLSIISIASKIARFPRHLSIHPGGIVIAPEPISNFTALQYAKNKGLGLIVTQPDMYGIEDLGLIKIDLLSQRSLGVVRDTLFQLGRKIKR